MSKRQIIIAVAVSVAVFAALYLSVRLLYRSDGERSEPEPQLVESNARGLELLRTVPVNTVGLVCIPRLERALETLRFAESQNGELSSLTRLDFGSFSNASAVISFFHLGSLVPLMSLDMGRNADNAAHSDTLALRAAEAGLFTQTVTVQFKNGRRDVMLLSSNRNLIASALRHIDSRSSVLDAPCFEDALAQASASSPVVIFPNSSAVRLLDPQLLRNADDRSRLAGFLPDFGEWTVMKLESSDGAALHFGVHPICNEAALWYANVLQGAQCGDSRLADILPEDTDYVVDIPAADFKAFLSARKSYLEAHAKLDAYGAEESALRKRAGVYPETWAAELAIKEIARVDSQGGQVLLVRPEKDPKAHNVKNFAQAGFLAHLFGAEFKLPNETKCACIGHWIVIGSEQSVRSFISSENRISGQEWPSKGVRLAVRNGNCLLCWNRQGLKLQYFFSEYE